MNVQKIFFQEFPSKTQEYFEKRVEVNDILNIQQWNPSTNNLHID